MKDFRTIIQEQKPSEKNVKCAEIKAIPTNANGFVEKQKNVFKIGEYNRATATFEMNSTEDLRQTDPKPKFDLSSDNELCHDFKSSFARSVVVNSSSKSQSLDYRFITKNDNSIKEELSILKVQNGGSETNGCKERIWMVPAKENSEIREDCLRNQEFLRERPFSRNNIPFHGRYMSNGSEKNFADTLMRSPLTASCRYNFNKPYFSGNDVNSVILHSQVTTLQWQLRQAEASRQMYRAVMEQVITFLQKTHKTLDILQNYLNDSDVESISRVSRSRSVQGVDTSSPQFSSSESEANVSFQKAQSFVQIGNPDCPKHGTMFREMSWRRSRKQQQEFEETSASKLSEEAVRLLRTIKSLFKIREPDLISRLNTSCWSPSNMAEVSSASSTVSATLDSDNSDIQLKETPFKNLSLLRDIGYEKKMMERETEEKDSLPHLSLNSADDESGFSSLNSFQEVGIPVSNFNFSPRTKTKQKGMQKIGHEDVGLPNVEDSVCKTQRRWSLTPSDNHLPKVRPTSLCTNGEVLRVLWV